jgi:hypothetical protein
MKVFELFIEEVLCRALNFWLEHMLEAVEGAKCFILNRQFKQRRCPVEDSGLWFSPSA